MPARWIWRVGNVSGKLDEHARTIFALIDRTQERAWAVRSTVFIDEPRMGD